MVGRGRSGWPAAETANICTVVPSSELNDSWRVVTPYREAADRARSWQRHGGYLVAVGHVMHADLGYRVTQPGGQSKRPGKLGSVEHNEVRQHLAWTFRDHLPPGPRSRIRHGARHDPATRRAVAGAQPHHPV